MKTHDLRLMKEKIILGMLDDPDWQVRSLVHDYILRAKTHDKPHVFIGCGLRYDPVYRSMCSYYAERGNLIELGEHEDHEFTLVYNDDFALYYISSIYDKDVTIFLYFRKPSDAAYLRCRWGEMMEPFEPKKEEPFEGFEGLNEKIDALSSPPQEPEPPHLYDVQKTSEALISIMRKNGWQG